jgi:hypothetical protein
MEFQVVMRIKKKSVPLSRGSSFAALHGLVLSAAQPTTSFAPPRIEHDFIKCIYPDNSRRTVPISFVSPK